MTGRTRYEETLDSMKGGRRGVSKPAGLDLRLGGDAIPLSAISKEKYPLPARRQTTVRRAVAKPRVHGSLSQLRSGDSIWARGMFFVDTFFAESAEHTWLLVPVFVLSFVIGTSFFPEFYYSWFLR